MKLFKLCDNYGEFLDQLLAIVILIPPPLPRPIEVHLDKNQLNLQKMISSKIDCLNKSNSDKQTFPTHPKCPSKPWKWQTSLKKWRR